MSHILFLRKNMLENRLENSIFPRVAALLIGWGSGVLLVLWLISAVPVSAQASVPPTPAPFVTPTPLPGVQASLNTAQQAQAAAQSSIAQAAQLDQLAAEMRRNAEAQQAQAAQAYSDARAATAAQNAAAAAEALGRGEAALSQLRDSVSGQAEIIATLTAKTGLQANEIYSLTINLQQARVDRQLAAQSYTALKEQTDKAAAQAETNSTLGYIIEGFLFIVFAVLFIKLISFVIGRRRDTLPHDDNHADAIPGEFTQTEEEQDTPKDEAM